ncbi:MAG: carbohydrate ABC transporter permease [Chloroflexaceae bacterium]|nr:carbohydrate ABC transporter permease [Chloroflexaceae bacterium]
MAATSSTFRPLARRPATRLLGNSLLYLVLIVISVVMLLPFFWMLSTALKGNSDIYKIPPDLLPREFHWENFGAGVAAINFGQAFVNSSIIALVNVVGSVCSSMLVGYGLSRINFPGRKVWFYIFVGSMMFPPIVSLIPMVRLYIGLGWYDTWWPLVLPAFLGNPLFIFLARQYYLSIPTALDEAAKMDGASHWTIFTRIMVPLTRPVWITMMIFAFQATWNDYLNPLVYLISEDKQMLSVNMASFAGAFAGVSTTRWNLYMATNLLYVLPPLLLFFAAQRYFMEGLGSLGTHTK